MTKPEPPAELEARQHSDEDRDECRPLPPLLVLCYHRIAPEIGDDPFRLTTTSERFAAQLDGLASWCRFVGPDDLRSPSAPSDLRPRVLVTFDDGYRDTLEHAFPLLRERGIPAVMFVATGAIDRSAPFWWEALARATAPGQRVSSGEQAEWRFMAPAQRAARVAALWAHLGRQARLDVEALAPTWPDLVDAAAGARVTLGAHTRAHSSLARLSADDLREELRHAAAALALHVGSAPTLFAYPHGGPQDVAVPAIDELRRQGFHFAFTTIAAAIAQTPRPGSRAALTLPRVVVANQRADELSARLSELAGRATGRESAPQLSSGGPRRTKAAIAVLSGISAHNLGDDAMLIATVTDLQRLCPEAEIRVLAENPAACGPVQRDLGVPILRSPHALVQRLLRALPPQADRARAIADAATAVAVQPDPWATPKVWPVPLEDDEADGLRWLIEADGVVDCGGANLDRHWMDYFYEKCFDYLLAARPLLVSGQGISRFDAASDRALLRLALDGADCVTVREAGSEARLREAGFSGTVLTTGDDALSLTAASQGRVDALLATLGLAPGDRFVAFQYRRCLDYRGDESLATMARAVTEASQASGLPVVGIPMHFGATDEREHLAAVRSRLPSPVALRVVPEELTAGEALGLFRRAAVAFGISYHSAVFSLSSGTPFLALYAGEHYAQKVTGLAQLYALPDLGLDLTTIRPGDVARTIARLLETRDEISRHLAERHAALMEAVRRPRRAFLETVRRRRAAVAPAVAHRTGGAPPRTPAPVRWGDLRRLDPVSAKWGFDRGQPVDRYYIETFLAQHASDVQGSVCELLNDGYTRRFGGDHVARSEVLDIDGANRRATIVDDLARPARLGRHQFDCFILTQTLPYIFDCGAALSAAFAATKPGGVLLVTVPSIIRYHQEPEDHWRFTVDSLARLLQDRCPGGRATITAYGNLVAAVAFLQGLASQELSPFELEHHDPRFPLVIAARVVKELNA